VIIEFVCEACHGRSRIDLDNQEQVEPLPGWCENLGRRAWIVTCPQAGCGVRSEVSLPLVRAESQAAAGQP
jgi:hypothetical protein